MNLLIELLYLILFSCACMIFFVYMPIFIVEKYNQKPYINYLILILGFVLYLITTTAYFMGDV